MAVTELACIGREAELDLLRGAFRAMQAGRGGLCLISGQTGSGKSTLVGEVVRREDSSDTEFAFGRCDQEQARAGPLLPWRSLLEDLTDVTLFEGASRGFGAKARESLAELAPDLVELLVPGVGLVLRSAKLITKNTSLGQRLTSAFTRGKADAAETIDADRFQLADQYISVLEDLANTKPLVLIIEDLHWADPGSLQMLAGFAKRAADKRMLAICTYRSGSSTQSDAFEDLRRHVETQKGVHIDLDANLRTTRNEFVLDYLANRVPGLDQAFALKLARHTGGIPLFVSCLVEHLIDQDQLTVDRDRWNVLPTLDWSTVPVDLETVFAEQLHSIDPDVRELLTIASVQGETFTAEIIASITKQANLDVVRALSRGQRAQPGIFESIGTTMLGAERVAQYRFRHALIQNYVLDAVDETERIYLHEAIGGTMRSIAGDHTEEISSQLAFHFDRAGRNNLAWTYYEIAANQSRGICSLELATQQIDRALELLPAGNTDDRIRLLELATNLAVSSGGRLDKAEKLVREAMKLAERGGTAFGQFDATLRKHLAHILIDQNRLEEADALIRKQMRTDVRERAITDIELLRALRALQNRLGKSEEALRTQLIVVDRWEGSEEYDENTAAQDLADLAWCFKETGRNAEAHENFERSLKLQKGINQPNWALLGQTLYALGDLFLNEEKYTEARPEIEQAIEVWARFDREYMLGVALNALANLENREHFYSIALRHARRAEQVTGTIVGFDGLETAFPITCQGEAYLGLSQYDEALQVLNRALEIREREKARPGNIAWTKWLLGRAYYDSGRDIEAGLALVIVARDALDALGDVARSEVAEIEAWRNQVHADKSSG